MADFYTNGYAVSFLLTAVLFFLFGLYVLIQSPRALLHRSFFLISCFTVIWLLSTALLLVSQSPFWVVLSYKGIYLGLTFIAVVIYAYSSIWLGHFEDQKKWVMIGGFAGVLFTSLIWFTPWIVYGYSRYPWGHYSRLTPAGGAVYILFICVYMLLFMFNFIRGFREASSDQVRKQSLAVLIGFFVAYLGLVDFLPCYGINVFPIGGFTTLALVCTLGYTVIRYKLHDIETVIHKTIMWFVSTVVAVLPFAGIIYSTQPVFKDFSPVESSLYFAAVAVLFYFYFRSIQPRLDQLFQRQRANLLAVLGRFSQELAHLKNLRDLLQSFARLMRSQLYVRRLSVYLIDEKKAEFVPTIAKGIRNLRPFPASHPFLKWLESVDSAVVGEFVIGDPSVGDFRSEIKAYFAATQAFVAVPFVLGDKLIGVANLGRKSNLRKYGFGEMQFFEQLKAPVTIAFSNSMRFEDIRQLSEELQQWNRELEKRVEDRTRELVKTQEQLIQAEKLATLGTLAGGVAHEINNPLTAVLTNAQLLRMSAREDEIDSISLIEEGAKRCQAIVQKLMKYARKTAEETPFRPVDLNEVVKSTLNLISFQFKQENVEIVTELAAVPFVSGIANELEQVLTNLLLNARDAVLAVSATMRWTDPCLPDRQASSGGKVKGRITVCTRKAGNTVELVVQDNGIGIPKGNLTKIFDPFFTTKDVGSGTGLGLAVSLGILKRHSASVAVDSTVGKGATFTLRFPPGTLSTPLPTGQAGSV